MMAERPKTALIVDDDPVLRKLVLISMKKAGLEVTVAVDGDDALRQLAAGSFDVIVSDCTMPDMDGFELTEQIRALPGLASTPIVLMTSGTIDLEDRKKAFQAGATAIVPRTPGLSEVVVTVRSLLQNLPN